MALHLSAYATDLHNDVRRWLDISDPMPSQRYSFELVKQAIKDNKLILITSDKRHWLHYVPSLADYGFIELNNNRSAWITPGNMPSSAWAAVIDRLES